MKFKNNRVYYVNKFGFETSASISTLKDFDEHYELYSDKESYDYVDDYIIKKFKEIKESFPEAFI